MVLFIFKWMFLIFMLYLVSYTLIYVSEYNFCSVGRLGVRLRDHAGTRRTNMPDVFSVDWQTLIASPWSSQLMWICRDEWHSNQTIGALQFVLFLNFLLQFFALLFPPNNCNKLCFGFCFSNFLLQLFGAAFFCTHILMNAASQAKVARAGLGLTRTHPARAIVSHS